MAHVARQVVQPRQASLIPERVHGLRSASRLNPRGARSIVGGETTTSCVLCGHFHVRPELVFQVGVAPARQQRSLKTLNPFAKDAHVISLNSRPTVHQRVDDADHPVPRLFLLGELAPASRRERVETGLAVCFGGAPIPEDQTALLQPHQRRIKRAHIELQRAAGHLLEARGNGVAVQCPERIQRLKDYQVEGALQNVSFGWAAY